jgi:ribosomal subunit interface protein
MEVPLEIAFVNMEPSEFVEQRVREKVARLERFSTRMTSCRVAVEVPHRQHAKGNLYHVRIEMRVPGKELVISRAPGDIGAHTDVYVAIQDAFEAAERQLRQDAEKRQDAVKAPAASGALQGRITRLFPGPGHGFIATTDGREIFFHRNAVFDADFDALEEGQTVELVLIHGESPMGPQATTVRPVGAMQFVDQPPKA